MTEAERQALTDELAALQRKLRARQGQSGFAGNVEAIKARIDEIAALLAD